MSPEVFAALQRPATIFDASSVRESPNSWNAGKPLFWAFFPLEATIALSGSPASRLVLVFSRTAI
jgi:hypothetical protein